MSSNIKVLEKVLYTTTASASAGRDGRAATDDGRLEVSLSVPKELGGSGASGTNPEQLFAAGYAACFGSAAAHVARAKRIQTGPITIIARVQIGPVGQAFGLAVELVADIPEMKREDAQQLIQDAHLVCPYSNATRGNIVVSVSLKQ